MTPEIEELTAKIVAHPADPWLYDERGWAFYKAGERRLAIRDFDRAIVLDDREAWFRLSRGEVYWRMGYIDQPREDFDRALELDPGYAYAYVVRGRYRSDHYEFDGALADLDRAVLLDPNDATYHHHRGSILFRMGELGRAPEDFNEAIRLDPGEAIHYFARYTLMARNFNESKFDETLGDLEKAVGLSPDVAFYRHHRGYMRYYQGCWAEAAEDFAFVGDDCPFKHFPCLKADLVAWLYLARLFEGEEPAGLRAVQEYLRWYSSESDAGEDAEPLEKRQQIWPVPVARFLAGEIDEQQFRESPPLDASKPGLSPSERELIQVDVMEHHFIIGELLLARGRRDEALEHLKEACGLPTWNPKRWIAAREVGR